ncbi:MAG: helix-turn-helix domain-containing protein [Lachnospiraceae bacterium]|nr:helix-turn-helix domain-containing protein [Lachnospiraceae bacterium]
MIIRLRIKEILEERGKSNYWLSQQLGMCYRNYHNIVTNKTSAIRFDTMERLCEILEIPVAELFEEIDESRDKEK